MDEMLRVARRLDRPSDESAALPLFLVSNSGVLDAALHTLQLDGGSNLTEINQLQLDITLLDPATRAAWRCLATFGELRPAYLDPGSFALMLRDVLTRSTATKEDAASGLGAISTALFPSWDLSAQPTVVRFEARAAAGGGSATLTVLVLHFSKSTDNAGAWAEALSSFAQTSRQLEQVQMRAVRAESDRAAAIAERDKIHLDKTASEALLLEGALKIVNTKKAKIRELADLLDNATARIAELEAHGVPSNREASASPSEDEEARRRPRQPSAEPCTVASSGQETNSQPSRAQSVEAATSSSAYGVLTSKGTSSTDQLLRLGL